MSKGKESVKCRYLVADNWGHCFMGSRETMVRWVYDVSEGKIVTGDAQLNQRWHMMSHEELKDVEESIHDNGLPERWEDFDLELVEALPDWAQPMNLAAITAKSKGCSEALRRLWENQRQRKDFGTVLTLRLTDQGRTLVDWVVASTAAPMMKKHEFTNRLGGGWVVTRERAFDDKAKHRQKLMISPESQPVVEGVAA